MAIRAKGALQRQLLTVFNLGTIGDLTDGQLLERFATRGDEGAELAFAALVERHGPMVLRVCRHAIRDAHDAEDAFQATFLILVKQARSLWVRDSIGPWLHRVALRVATKARLSAARMHAHERRAAVSRLAVTCEGDDWDEVGALLHKEIERLPERYRVPVVLCDLQGVTHEKAARHLGWPVGTVKTRLARARELLRGRLSRRGLGLPAGLMVPAKIPGAVFPFGAVEVALPGTLVESTVRAGTHLTAGKVLAAGVISSQVAMLTEEVLKTMVVTKLKLASVVVLIGTAGAAAVLAQQGPRREANPPRGGTSAEFGQPAAGGSGHVVWGAPAYIKQSRALVITRLEEEVAEAQARVDRTLKKFQSPDHPAVIRARDTLDALVQRLEKIDRVLVDVVETYPTMVDFSGGSDHSDARSERELGYRRTIEELEHKIAELQVAVQLRRAEAQLQVARDNAAKQGQDGQKPNADSQENPSKSREKSESRPADIKNENEQRTQNGRNTSPGGAEKAGQSKSNSGESGHGFGMVTADLDGDGLLDISVANEGLKSQPQSGQQKANGSQKHSSRERQNGQQNSSSGENGPEGQPQDGQPNSSSGNKDQRNQPQDGQRNSSSGNKDQRNQPQDGQPNSSSGENAPGSQPQTGKQDSSSGENNPKSRPQNGQRKDGSEENDPKSQAQEKQSEAVPF